MQIYLDPRGMQLLQNVYNGSQSPLNITGSQIGTTKNFIPDSSLLNAQGLLLDNRSSPTSVTMTPVHLHEIIFTVCIKEDKELLNIGNVLLFANDTPFIWSISPSSSITSLKTNSEAHFAGDRTYFPVLVRYPYIKNLINLNTASLLNARFPVINNIFEVPVPEHIDQNQIFVEKNNLHYGSNKPFLASKSLAENGWMASPLIMPLDDTSKFGVIDGGSTKTGF